MDFEAFVNLFVSKRSFFTKTIDNYSFICYNKYNEQMIT